MSECTPEAAFDDLHRMGPGAFCEDCGHFAARHIGLTCYFREDGCTCGGMLWQGHKIRMGAGLVGPIELES